MSEQKKKFSIFAFSGTIEKFLPLGVFVSGAATTGYEVNLLFLGPALLNVTKTGIKNQPAPIDKNYEQMGSMLMKRVQELKFPMWYQLIEEAKKTGRVKVYACKISMELFGLKKEDLADFVDDAVEPTVFFDRAEGGITLFI